MEKESSHKKKGLKPIEVQIIWLFVILGLVLLSFLVSYQYFKPSSSFKYGDFTVFKSQIKGIDVNFYLIPLQVKGSKATNIVLRTDPRETSDLNFSLDDSSLGGISKVWLTTDPDYDSYAVIASKEIGAFTQIIGLSTSYALTKDKVEGFPLMTCANATKELRVIDLRITNSTSVYSEGDCIVVEGADYPQLIAASDKLVLEWLSKLYRGRN